MARHQGSRAPDMDQDPLDFTVDPTQYMDNDLEANKIRLHAGIDLQSLVTRGEGAIFEPEVDESLFETSRPEDRNYFMSPDEDFEAKLDRLKMDDTADQEEEEHDFHEKAKKMDQLLDDGGVKKRILFHGLESEGLPPVNGTVTIHYSMYLENQDEPYDSTVLRGRPEKFKLDDGRLLPGVELAVKSMLKRERAEFLIHASYAFGAMGCPPRVPANAEILAKIELLAFYQEAEAEALLSVDPKERRKLKTFDEIERVAKIEHVEGNILVKAEDWRAAAKRYERGIQLLEDAELRDEKDELRQKHLLNRLQLNRSHCCLKIGWPKKACIALKKALELEPKNAKALYRMGKAKRMLGSLEDAREYLLKAQRLAPLDTTIGQELVSLDRMVQKERDDEKAMFSRMLKAKE